MYGCDGTLLVLIYCTLQLHRIVITWECRVGGTGYDVMVNWIMLSIRSRTENHHLGSAHAVVALTTKL